MARVFIWILGFLIIAAFGPIVINSLFKTEERVAEKVTIQVLSSDNPPVPISRESIRLETEDGTTSIQYVTDRSGKIYFKRLVPPGKWRIRATQVLCDGGKTKVQTLSVVIRGSSSFINYFPCG